MKQQDIIFLVTCTEHGNAGDYEFTVEAFAMRYNAELWVERRIATLVAENGLDTNKDVDGWFVKIDGWHHTIQFDILELELK